MDLKPIYIPFQSIFPNLTGYLSSKEDFKHFTGIIDQKTPYGQAHKGATAIDRRISNLHLIMHRIRIDSGVNILPTESYMLNFIYLPIDFESFFVWIRMIMDLVAYLTPLFYKRNGVIPRNSFNDQLDWFINKRPEFDSVYTAYLKDNMSWFTHLRDTRDDSLHRHFWAYADTEESGQIMIKRMRGNKVEEEVQSLAKTIGDVYLRFVDFSKFYEEHFRKQLKDNEKYDYRTLDARMVAEYSASIKYFIEQAG